MKRDPLLRGTVVHRSRRLQARRRSPVQGDPAQQHARRRPRCCPRAHRSPSPCATAATTRRRRADHQAERVEHGGVDDAPFPPEGALGNYSRPRHASRAICRSRAAPGTGAAGATTSADYRDYKKTVTGSFLVAAYRAPGLPRRRHADGRLADRRRSAERRRHGAVSLRRADGQAPVALGVHAHAGLFGARRRSPTSSPTSAGPSSAIRTDEDQRRQAAMGADDDDVDGRPDSSPLTLDTDAKAGVPYRLHARGRRRGRVASAHREPRRPARSIRPRGHIGIKQPPLFGAAGRRPEDGARRRRPRRRAGAGRQDRSSS